MYYKAFIKKDGWKKVGIYRKNYDENFDSTLGDWETRLCGK
jgi:hypothetical protein